MTTYSKEIEKLLRRQRSKLKSTERHKDFYPLVDELELLQHSYCYFSQYSDYLEITVYCKKEADKTYPQYVRENILTHAWLEEEKEPRQHKKSGEYHFFFQYKNYTFGKGERPKLSVKVDYSNLCRRIVTGRESYELTEYVCD